ncbi:6,7-dimethyl-8-ribityllumazine synthase [Rariglobus hedericola]|uniref:6,7-dimethyl-8-ribityllumazine synthase n=1 Tax=Rariglobus hedericola TaxID=2597822 RepID=A0A556QKG3_9BACT|nr:6,7-dimethyl-8-ribityllumazine synthase [Rariglobus hedericola]TSJ77136.1 6,7-dimethyl-8-ribityllumazine synthase [Rariglobus hedericola]
MSLDAPKPLSVSGADYRIGIVAARFNSTLVDALVDRGQAWLVDSGVAPAAIEIVRVPGSHEIPWAAQQLAASARFDAVIGLGVLIAGDTNHHEMVGDAVAAALMRVSLDTGVPVINGVIVVNTLAQAEARATGSINRGTEFAAAALEMAVLKKKLSQ